MIPKQSDIDLPLLKALMELGGEAKPKAIYPLVTDQFPQITDEDLSACLKHGEFQWINRIQWVRQSLIASGDMYSPRWGVWAITEQGRQRLAEAGSTAGHLIPIPSKSLVQLHEEYDQQFRSKLLEKLFELTPTQFEHFGEQLLTAYGLVKMTVTSRSRDGGIDGHGLLKIGLARMTVAGLAATSPCFGSLTDTSHSAMIRWYFSLLSALPYLPR